MDQVIDTSLDLILSNIPALMYVLAILLSSIIVNSRRQRRQRRHNINTFIAYTMLLAVGVSGVWGFVVHAFFPKIAASAIGWEISPFQFEVAMANLAMGAAGLFAFKASHGFRVATTLFVTIFLWGSAIGHGIQMALYKNYSSGNAGVMFATDILIPATLIILVCLHRKYQDHVFS